MGRLSDALKQWSRALSTLKNAESVEKRTKAKGKLDVAWNALLEATISEDPPWDDEDNVAWEILKKLDEGEF